MDGAGFGCFGIALAFAHGAVHQIQSRYKARKYCFRKQSATYIRSGAITLQVQSAEIKNKMSEYVRAVQNVSTVDITVRGVPVAVLMPIAKPVRKSVFQARVLSFRATPAAPKLDVMPALQVGRKCSA